MKRRWKVLSWIGGIGVAALAVLALALAYTSDCVPAPPLAAGAERMQAVTARCYGPPEVLVFGEGERPALAADRVRVRVHVASANPLDWHAMRGEPYVMRLSSGLGAPHDPRVGADFAGVVEAVGAGVTGYAPGDRVFGAVSGAFAEFVDVRPARIARLPEGVSFEHGAAVPVAAVTALQALRDKGGLKPGGKVLVNGASGGVGTFAVQLAKALGAEVTGVASTRNLELLRSIGADHVVDYTREDFTRGAARYDVIVDLVGTRGLAELAAVTAPGGAVVLVGSLSKEPFLGPVWRFLAVPLVQPFVDARLEGILAEITHEDLAFLAGLMADGRLVPVIDRRYPLAEAAEAIRYLETGRARGKVLVTVD